MSKNEVLQLVFLFVKQQTKSPAFLQMRTNGDNVLSSPITNISIHAILSGITPEQAEKLFTPTIKNPKYHY